MNIILIIGVWSFAGFVFLGLIAQTTSLGELDKEFHCFNPIWLHRTYYPKFSKLDCVFISLLLSLLCPPITVVYTLYKIWRVFEK